MQNGRFVHWHLLVLSFAILFLEMAVIRWLNASITVLSYFNNLILISCFFGLGVGCLLSRRRVSLSAWYPPVFLVFVLTVVLFKKYGFEVSYTDDVVFVDSMEFYVSGALTVSLAALLGFFVNMALFVILGQELGRLLESVGDPLRAYAYDIAGSLLGTLGYAALAWLGTPPHVWFAMGTLLLLVLVRKNLKLVILGLLLISPAVFLMSTTYRGAKWSPYYKVEAVEYRNPENRNLGFRILVDNMRIQDALNFSPDLSDSKLSHWIGYYQLPYRLTRPGKVLILGAGSGNEAFMASLHGAEEIHAVEIDPVMADFGRTLHPNAPYLQDNVRLFVDDARAFLAKARDRYDLIVMSALDSHKQIAGMSSLRLESFVYTVESYRRIRELLAPGGVFCLNLGSTRPWMGERTYWSLTEAFGEEPKVFRSERSPFGSVAYVFGPDASLQRDLLPDEPPFARLPPYPKRAGVRPCTDNWPYLYLETNRIPRVCLVILGAILILSFAIVAGVERSVRRPDLHFFLLGAGFMLLETRSITQMALVFGSTWHINAIVVAAVLLTIFVANALVRKGRGISSKASYLWLLSTLALGYFFPFEALLQFGLAVRLGIAGLVVGLPILWAAFIFSNSFRQATKVGTAFGSNLLGVVVGGALEYTSNIWGLDVLYVVAAVVYLASFLFSGSQPLAGTMVLRSRSTETT